MTAATWRGLAGAGGPVIVLGAFAMLVAAAATPPDVPQAAAPLKDASPSGALVMVLLLTVAPLALRRVAPSLVLVAVVLVTLMSPTGDDALAIQVLAGALASYTVGDQATDRMRSALFVVGVAALATVGALLSGTDAATALVIPFAALLPAWLVGDAARNRRIEARRRDEAARRARHDREVELRAAASEERRRVARELHDIVAHTVSVMVVQASAARKVLAQSPERADGALAAVEGTGREAMAELRQVLGVLRADDEPAGITPQPGLGEVAALVARVRQAGLPVALTIDGDPGVLPAPISVVAYRIVQEALTNALRYAGGARTVVHVCVEPSQLRVEVSDNGPAASITAGHGAGLGLGGMAERTKLLGGRIETGPHPGGGFAVRAWLPIEGVTP